MVVYVIGCGGTGGWVATLLSKMLGPEDQLVLQDKDKFEKRNMDRQIGCRVGTNKAEALARVLKDSRCCITVVTEWFNGTVSEIRLSPDALFCCADNHRARVACINYVNEHPQCTAYIAGNEYSSFEGYVYRAFMNGHPVLDPREKYPEIKFDKTGDPLSPSCTGEALEGTPQLALANMQAAAAITRLWYFWEFILPGLGLDRNLQATASDDKDAEALAHTVEYHISGSDGKLKTHTIGEAI